MPQARLNLRKTREIPNPTYYVEALQGEYSQYAFTEELATTFKGQWRQLAFHSKNTMPMDLEIGTGSGLFFSSRAQSHPDRLLLGFEIKFKPLIQTIRRALNANCKNVRVARYHASLLDDVFEKQEIDHVFIHHPDPWSKRRRQKHRLMNREFLNQLHQKQKPGSFLDFKTDSYNYFLWAVDELKHSPYIIKRYTENLHQSEWQSENVITQFERIFTAKGQSIYYLRADCQHA